MCIRDSYTSLTYFSGFHGENSNFVVTMTESAVWADGRYFVQAEKEIACLLYTSHETSHHDILILDSSLHISSLLMFGE